MKTYTQKEFDALPVISGYKQCPTGDYSQINSFPERCRFGKGCSFGEWCRFGGGCSFGERCSLGERCSFGEVCSFAERCRFGKGCRFGKLCSFGEWCRFGKGCRFEGGMTPKDSERPYFAVDRIGSDHRKAYFFDFLEGGIHVRAGFFFGTKAEFLEKLHADQDPRKTKTYEAALALAEMVLGAESEAAS